MTKNSLTAASEYCKTCNAPHGPIKAVMLRCGLCAVINGKLPPTKYQCQNPAMKGKTMTELTDEQILRLLAYEVTVHKLRAERKPMGPDDAVYFIFAADIAAPPKKIWALIRAVEAFHGIGDKT